MLYPLQMAISLNSLRSHFLLFIVVHVRSLYQGSVICACDYFHLHKVFYLQELVTWRLQDLLFLLAVVL